MLGGRVYFPADFRNFTANIGYDEWPEEVLVPALREILVRLAALRFPLSIYRGLGLPEGIQPRLGPNGSWTYARAVAEGVARGEIEAAGAREGDVPWLLMGTVRSASDVDWDLTINWNFRFDDEAELALGRSPRVAQIHAERLT